MDPIENYKAINKASWNAKTELHFNSSFYDVDGFLKGNSSLNDIELKLLGDIKGKTVLHLQCHFGQDSISLERLGARVTGVDLSDKAILKAEELAKKAGVATEFICCDVYELPKYLDRKFDIVFTSYGTIGWLPDLDRWAQLIANFLKPGGQFVFVEFHPVVWMFDDDFKEVKYDYLNKEAIVETLSGTYAEKDADISGEYVTWNHGIGEVINSLVVHGIQIASFDEYDYSPYDCFAHTEEFEQGKFRIKHLKNRIPMVYAISGKMK